MSRPLPRNAASTTYIVRPERSVWENAGLEGAGFVVAMAVIVISLFAAVLLWPSSAPDTAAQAALAPRAEASLNTLRPVATDASLPQPSLAKPQTEAGKALRTACVAGKWLNLTPDQTARRGVMCDCMAAHAETAGDVAGLEALTPVLADRNASLPQSEATEAFRTGHHRCFAAFLG
jgi:hypothetical protein